MFLRSSIYVWAAGDLRQRKAAVDVRAHPPGFHAFEESPHPPRRHLGLAPHVTEIDAEDGFVRVHERHRMEERHARGGPAEAKRSRELRGRRGGDAEHPEPAARAQRTVALLPMRTTERIDDERDTLPAGETIDLFRPIRGAVVDELLSAALEEERMLRAAGRAVDRRADMPGDVDRGETDASAGIVDEHRLFRA